MGINNKQFNKLKKLSQLEFSDAESTKMIADLNALIEFVKPVTNSTVKQIYEANRSVHIGSLRQDIATNSDVYDTMLRNAPQEEGGYIIVPKVVD